MTNVFKGDYSVKKVMLMSLYHVKWDRIGSAMSLFGRYYMYVIVIFRFEHIDVLVQLGGLVVNRLPPLETHIFL